MRVGHARQMHWLENALPHRGGTIAFKYLLEGEDGTPDNFSLILAREGSDFCSPRHRHAWDQIRFCLEGSVPIGPGVSVDAGEVGYFPEGVPYGPQEGSGYPKPRYKAPVIMKPDRFAWQADADWPGVERRVLGTFTERATRIEFVKIAPSSAIELGVKDAQHVIFVRRGTGGCADVGVDEGTAVLLAPGETARINAETEIELLVVALPLIGPHTT